MFRRDALGGGLSLLSGSFACSYDNYTTFEHREELEVRERSGRTGIKLAEDQGLDVIVAPRRF